MNIFSISSLFSDPCKQERDEGNSISYRQHFNAELNSSSSSPSSSSSSSSSDVNGNDDENDSRYMSETTPMNEYGAGHGMATTTSNEYSLRVHSQSPDDVSQLTFDQCWTSNSQCSSSVETSAGLNSYGGGAPTHLDIALRWKHNMNMAKQQEESNNQSANSNANTNTNTNESAKKNVFNSYLRFQDKLQNFEDGTATVMSRSSTCGTVGRNPKEVLQETLRMSAAAVVDSSLRRKNNHMITPDGEVDVGALTSAQTNVDTDNANGYIVENVESGVIGINDATYARSAEPESVFPNALATQHGYCGHPDAYDFSVQEKTEKTLASLWTPPMSRQQRLQLQQERETQETNQDTNLQIGTHSDLEISQLYTHPPPPPPGPPPPAAMRIKKRYSESQYQISPSISRGGSDLRKTLATASLPQTCAPSRNDNTDIGRVKVKATCPINVLSKRQANDLSPTFHTPQQKRKIQLESPRRYADQSSSTPSSNCQFTYTPVPAHTPKGNHARTPTLSDAHHAASPRRYFSHTPTSPSLDHNPHRTQLVSSSLALLKQKKSWVRQMYSPENDGYSGAPVDISAHHCSQQRQHKFPQHRTDVNTTLPLTDEEDSLDKILNGYGSGGDEISGNFGDESIFAMSMFSSSEAEDLDQFQSSPTLSEEVSVKLSANITICTLPEDDEPNGKKDKEENQGKDENWVGNSSSLIISNKDNEGWKLESIQIDSEPTSPFEKLKENVTTEEDHRAALAIQSKYRGYTCRHNLLQELGIAKRKWWEQKTKSAFVTKVHSNIRRAARKQLHLKHGRLVCSMVVAVRHVCAFAIQNWWRNDVRAASIRHTTSISTADSTPQHTESDTIDTDDMCGYLEHNSNKASPGVKLEKEYYIAQTAINEDDVHEAMKLTDDRFEASVSLLRKKRNGIIGRIVKIFRKNMKKGNKPKKKGIARLRLFRKGRKKGKDQEKTSKEEVALGQPDASVCSSAAVVAPYQPLEEEDEEFTEFSDEGVATPHQDEGESDVDYFSVMAGSFASTLNQDNVQGLLSEAFGSWREGDEVLQFAPSI